MLVVYIRFSNLRVQGMGGLSAKWTDWIDMHHGKPGKFRNSTM